MDEDWAESEQANADDQIRIWAGHWGAVCNTELRDINEDDIDAS